MWCVSRDNMRVTVRHWLSFRAAIRVYDEIDRYMYIAPPAVLNGADFACSFHAGCGRVVLFGT